VFLAVDRTKLQDLDEAARKFIAWESVLAEKDVLDLGRAQINQAETQRKGADDTVVARLPEAYQWLLVPVQNNPQAEVQWQATKLTGTEGLAARASKKLKGDELLMTVFGPTRLRMELDRVPLWRGNHVAVGQLFEDFAKYAYLPRLKSSRVLVDAMQSGVALLTWTQDSFAYADSYDSAADRYRGLVYGRMVSVPTDGHAGILVHPDAAMKQIQAETPVVEAAAGPSYAVANGFELVGPEAVRGGGVEATKPKRLPTRFHGSVELDPARVGRDAGRIADEVLSHLAGLVGSSVRVTLEIEALVPAGASDEIVRVVTENARTLKFGSQGFEND
jgi:hypothetical protein